MKLYQLDPEEEEILRDFEAGKYKPVADFAKRKKELMAAARETLNKTKNINIRLSERDLLQLKAKAIEEGIPYQTLVTSVLHKYTTGTLSI